MKKNLAYSALGLIIIALTAFNFHKEKIAIGLVDLNREINTKSFGVDQPKVILNESEGETFYVLIRENNISGKKRVNYERIKRKGKRFRIIFIVESKSSGKKLFKRRTSFIQWNDGEIYDPNLIQPIDIGNYHFKVRIDKD